MNKIDEINEIINALEEMSCEHAFSHGQMAVKEFIPKIIETFDKEIELQSRKDKLVVGSEWECVVNTYAPIKKVYIDPLLENNYLKIGKSAVIKVIGFDDMSVYIVRDTTKCIVAKDQFLLCFKPKGNGFSV